MSSPDKTVTESANTTVSTPANQNQNTSINNGPNNAGGNANRGNKRGGRGGRGGGGGGNNRGGQRGGRNGPNNEHFKRNGNNQPPPQQEKKWDGNESHHNGPQKNADDRQMQEKLATLSTSTIDLPVKSFSESKFSGRSRLYVGNLGNDITENDLKEHFASYGEIAEVFLNKEKGFAFVRLVSYFLNDLVHLKVTFCYL